MTMKLLLRMRPTLAVLAVAMVLGGIVTLAFKLGPAFADEDGGHSDGGYDGVHGGGGQGASGGHDDGHDEGEHDDGHLAGGPGGSGAGQGGDGQSSGGQHGDGQLSGHGGSTQAGRTGSSQGRPVWAREDIPEVELGRLNVVRSPSQVLDRAYLEALATLDAKTAAFYSLSLEDMEIELRENWENVSIIDSPLQNLALFRDALDGESILQSKGIGVDTETLMAAFLGTASDKSIALTPDTVIAVATILGGTMDDETAAEIADDAERIRSAIEDGHG